MKVPQKIQGEVIVAVEDSIRLNLGIFHTSFPIIRPKEYFEDLNKPFDDDDIIGVGRITKTGADELTVAYQLFGVSEETPIKLNMMFASTYQCLSIATSDLAGRPCDHTRAEFYTIPFYAYLGEPIGETPLKFRGSHSLAVYVKYHDSPADELCISDTHKAIESPAMPNEELLSLLLSLNGQITVAFPDSGKLAGIFFRFKEQGDLIWQLSAAVNKMAATMPYEKHHKLLESAMQLIEMIKRADASINKYPSQRSTKVLILGLNRISTKE